MCAKRNTAIAGIQRNVRRLHKPQEIRDFLIVRARFELSTCYLCVIAGYTYATDRLATYHQCGWDTETADQLQKAFMRLRIDKEVDPMISLADSVFMA